MVGPLIEYEITVIFNKFVFLFEKDCTSYEKKKDSTTYEKKKDSAVLHV